MPDKFDTVKHCVRCGFVSLLKGRFEGQTSFSPSQHVHSPT